MPASTFTAITSFKVVLFGKTSVSLGSQVIIAIFNRDSFSFKIHAAKLQFLILKT